MVIELDCDFDPRECLSTWKAAPPCTDVFTSSVSVYKTCSAQFEIACIDVTSMTWASSRAADAGTDEVCGPSGWFCGCGDAVGSHMDLYLMVHCMLSGSGGCSAWREPWGKSCLKKSLPYGTSSPAAVGLPQRSRKGGVENGWFLRCIYEQSCLFINYLKWTTGTPSLCGLNSPL